MEEQFSQYADIVLPLAVPQYYTYGIPDKFNESLKPGLRVIVALGKRRLYTGIVRNVHVIPPEGMEIRPVLDVLDESPLVGEKQMAFWEWIADYYLCTVGEVYKAALPSGLKLESQTSVFAKEFIPENIKLSAQENELLLQISESQGITINKLLASATGRGTLAAVKHLAELGLVSLEENVKETYKPKQHTQVFLNSQWEDETQLSELLNRLEKKAPKQAELLQTFLRMTAFENGKSTIPLVRGKLLAESQTSQAILTALIKKGILRIEHEEISRLGNMDRRPDKPFTLNTKQQEAFSAIKDHFTRKDIVLLHGVTSSGKTEIYIHLINEYAQAGKQVLYLLPEIGLTAQIIRRLQRVFGNRIGVYHSRFSDAERVEVYQNLAGIRRSGSPEYQIILGVRSSIFLPFSNLGLVIIDEEHENTYKQFDPAPRYNARDAAVVLASMHQAKVLMGTATPSFESYTNAWTGRYELVELTDRYQDMQMPKIDVVNVIEARHKKLMSTHFSSVLLNAINETLTKHEQVILFQNRRGFSPYVECNDCGWIPYCKHCDVSLTYHKQSNRLICHYCGYSIAYPKGCSSCGSQDIRTRGFGTEKVEDEAKIHFPDARIARMDLDSTRTRRSYEQLIDNFEHRRIDILIGTQMVSKGLDFEHVKVVGILNADNMLNFPDFRSYERSYQLMAQVSGRSGRKNTRGTVIIQTADPENVVVRHVVNNAYREFFMQQLAERRNFKYPPFYRLVKLTLRNRSLALVSQASNRLADDLKRTMGDRVVGPEFPLINRVFNFHQKCILVKIERDQQFSEHREQMRAAIAALLSNEEYKGVQVVADVDPLLNETDIYSYPFIQHIYPYLRPARLLHPPRRFCPHPYQTARGLRSLLFCY